MPDGVVLWFDPQAGEGRVVRARQQYPVEAGDIERAARHPGARVHFDIQRRSGVEVAVDVRLRTGARVSKGQRRFGDLVGSRRPDAKSTAPLAAAHPDLGLRLDRQPLLVARSWAEQVAAGDPEQALLLYAPNAAVHEGGEVIVGRAKIRSWLTSGALAGLTANPDIHGLDRLVVVSWGGIPGGPTTETHLRIEHGAIAEQWLGTYVRREVTGEGAGEPGTTIHITTAGPVDNGAKDYAFGKVAKMVNLLRVPILYALVRLERAADPAVVRPATIQATLDVNGQLVRAHVSGHEFNEAADLLEQRLRDKLEHLAERREAIRQQRATGESGAWRRGARPTPRPPYFDRPADEREVVRHKTFAVEELTVDEAAFDMELLDYDFYLFRELATGQDAVIHREPEGFALWRLEPNGESLAGAAIAVRIDPTPAPALGLDEAVERLNTSGEQFVFYRHPETGRGNVLYRRYDGHYGLLVPAAEEAEATSA